MLKVCIESSYPYIQRYVNYGSLLQYYALHTWFADHECKAYWLRFNWVRLTRAQKRERRRQAVQWPQETAALMRVRSSFRKFVKQRLNTTPYYSRTRILNAFPPRADLYITGSDQVWGSYSDVNYLLFAPDDRVKASYAASFGRTQIDDAYAEKARKALRRFDGISVREDSGVVICERLGFKAEHVLDPTLLLNGDDYPSKSKGRRKAPYVLCYFLNDTRKEQIHWDAVTAYAEETGCNPKLVAVENTYLVFEQDCLWYLSPEEWLDAYRNAKAIITNSFHGTAFAVIFKKPFLVVLQQDDYARQNTRMDSLLKTLGLRERVYDPQRPLKQQMEEDINWDTVYALLEAERNRSNEFLQHLIDMAKRRSASTMWRRKERGL